MEFKIREIEEKDNLIIEKIIRDCLIEYGGNKEGTAWGDPGLGRFSYIYSTPGNKYWVAESESGEVVGGVGIGALDDINDICELQKMYCKPSVRGKGASHLLIETALSYAEGIYKRCYLETMENMYAAQRFYEKYGFEKLDKPLCDTGHFACDVPYAKIL